jgi:hypothetical protein
MNTRRRRSNGRFKEQAAPGSATPEGSMIQNYVLTPSLLGYAAAFAVLALPRAVPCGSTEASPQHLRQLNGARRWDSSYRARVVMEYTRGSRYETR